jgi:hypothetical protein
MLEIFMTYVGMLNSDGAVDFEKVSMLRKTFFFMVLGFELRASDFLSKPSSI